MLTSRIKLTLGLVIFAWATLFPHLAGSTERPLLPAETTADYIYSIISADRTIYSEYIVERLTETIHLPASENWKQEDTLPLPAQFLLAASRRIQENNSGMQYRLLSLWPINKANGPLTEQEKTGLEQVAKDPSKPYSWVVKTDRHTQFHALYPDLAVTRSCVQCHNAHPKSPKKDFHKGDVMGGIHISFPIQEASEKTGATGGVPPEIAADYVHSILEADRTVYAQDIVNRLQKKKRVYASENWWEENTLLLPAQFLLNASELIRHRKPGLDFKLISQWPINDHNGPANEFESEGLQQVAEQPLRPYIGQTRVGNRTYFQAVYPDIAVTPACVSCHNAHPKSPKHDFKLFDVIGGIVVSFPVKASD